MNPRMKQRVFLTTVNETKHRLDMQYYCHLSAAESVRNTAEPMRLMDEDFAVYVKRHRISAADR